MTECCDTIEYQFQYLLIHSSHPSPIGMEPKEERGHSVDSLVLKSLSVQITILMWYQ